MEKLSVKVEQADLLASAKSFAAYQFAMYGMNNVPDEQLESFAKNILSQEKESRRIAEQVENEKTIAAKRAEEEGVGYNTLYYGRDPDNERNRMAVLGNPSL